MNYLEHSIMTAIQNLTSQIEAARSAYYNGEAILSDEEFDALIYELTSLDPKNPLLAEVGAPASNEWVKTTHLFPLGSLNKVNTPAEMTNWINTTLKGGNVLVSEKLDGLSIGCQYQKGKLVKAILRGNGLEGENILANVVKMKGVVKKMKTPFDGTIRGEIVLLKNDHEEFFPDYANPRNAASGLCRRSDGEGSEHLTLMMYDVMPVDDDQVSLDTETHKFTFLQNEGFSTPNWAICKTPEALNKLWQDYQDGVRDTLNYEIDGLVVAADDMELQTSLGEHNLRPKGKIAFKFANQFVKTTVEKITLEPGTMGRQTPRCWFKPINILGSTVEKASIYNLDYINKLGLGIGAEVLVCKAGEIIPRVERVVKAAPIVFQCPEECQACGTKLVMEGKHLMCLNVATCPAQLSGRIRNWVKELNILELGKKLIEKLVETGLVATPADLYTLTVDDLAGLERMGTSSAKKVHTEIWKCNPITLDIFLGALSIPMIGGSSIRAIMNAGHPSLEAIQQLTVKELEAINGIGPGRAKSLSEGLEANKEIIAALLANGVQIKEKAMSKQGALTGKTFVITGTLSRKRDEVAAMIEEAGGVMQNGVGKGTNFLVIADPSSTSSKAQKARKLGTELIGEEQLMEMLGQ
jgi:DNA ligase (NAD+)